MVTIWRNDDVNPNTDFAKTKGIYSLLREQSPEAEIWSCVNIFSSSNNLGSLYAEVPFKNRPISWFYNVDKIASLDWVNRYREISKVVSHGLFHINHAKVSKDTQEMSILSSCRLLKTDIFVPPFNSYNFYTAEICKNNGIRLVTPSDNWRSLEFMSFDSNHENWYMHSWRWTAVELEKKLCQLVA